MTSTLQKILQGIMVALLLATSTIALGEEANSGSDDPVVENRNDLSVQMLRGIFGDVVNIIQGGEAPDSPDSLLGHVMLAWCLILFSIVMLMIGWNLFSWFFAASHSGKNSKSDVDQAGVSIRLIIALVSTVPLSAGYCFFQYGHIYMTGHSINAANSLANVVYDNMKVGGQFNSQIETNADRITAQVFESIVCQEAYNAVEDEEYIQTTKSVELDTSGTSELELKLGPSHIFGIVKPSSCGRYWIKSDTPDFKFALDGVPEEVFLENSFNALINAHNELGPIAIEFVNSVLIDQVSEDEVAALLTNTQQDLDRISLSYDAAINSARKIYSEQKNEEIASNSSDLPHYLQPVPSIMSNYSVRDIGWVALGATWWIESIRNQAFYDLINSMSLESQANLEYKIVGHEDLTEIWKLVSKVTAGKSGRLFEVSGESSDSIEVSKNEKVDLFIRGALATVTESNDLLYSLNELGHEMIATAEVMIAVMAGAQILIEVSDNLGKSESGIPGLDFFMGTLKAVAAGTSEGILKHMVIGLFFLIAFLLSTGMYLAFYLPIIPLMHWMGGVISAFTAVIEQVVLAPIHGLSHAFTGGKGFIGERAQQGYLLAFATFIRMPLLVIGFIVVYPFLLMVGKLIIIIWAPFAEGMTSNSVVGLVSFFGLVGGLISLSVSSIERVFGIMNEINDRAIRLLGAQADSLGAQSFIHTGQAQFSSMQQTVSQIPQQMAPSDKGTADKSLKP